MALACGSREQQADNEEPLGTSEEALHTVPGKVWVPQGPGPINNGQQFVITPNNPVTGGGHALVTHPTNANIAYFGGINAGIWRTDNATATQPTWTPLTDFQPSLNIGALALDRNNPEFGVRLDHRPIDRALSADRRVDGVEEPHVLTDAAPETHAHQASLLARSFYHRVEAKLA